MGCFLIPVSPGRSSAVLPDEYTIACSSARTPGLSVARPPYVKIGLSAISRNTCRRSFKSMTPYSPGVAEFPLRADYDETTNLGVYTLSEPDNREPGNGGVVVCDSSGTSFLS
jgi:hypothetical protein